MLFQSTRLHLNPFLDPTPIIPLCEVHLVWVNFIKALTLTFFHWRKITQKYILEFKTPVFLATHIEQHVANVSLFIAHFGILVTRFGFLKPNWYYEIEL